MCRSVCRSVCRRGLCTHTLPRPGLLSAALCRRWVPPRDLKLRCDRRCGVQATDPLEIWEAGRAEEWLAEGQRLAYPPLAPGWSAHLPLPTMRDRGTKPADADVPTAAGRVLSGPARP